MRALFFTVQYCVCIDAAVETEIRRQSKNSYGSLAVAVFAVIALCNEILQKLHINGNVEDFSFARNRAWIAVGMVIVCVGCLGISIKSSEHIMEKMEEF